jgi:hypothetical protein
LTRRDALRPFFVACFPLYIEAVGEIDTESKREGFAQSYDGLFHLREVSRVSDAVPEACS